MVIKDIIAQMGMHEQELRSLIEELRAEMFAQGTDQIEFDGDILHKDTLDLWYSMLEAMDKFCFYV